jgi:hypothetical protein
MNESGELKQLAKHFADGLSIFTTSPLYQSFCTVVAQDQPTLELLTQRQMGQQASFLLFGAVHYLLLSRWLIKSGTDPAANEGEDSSKTRVLF